MTKKLRTILVSIAAVAMLLVPSLAVSPVLALTNLQGGLTCGSNFDISGNTGCTPTGTTTDFNTLLTTIINIFSAIVGVIAVIMIIVGGLRYITSGGDSSKVGAAKQTLIYAIIGLVIVALAQLIVHFVLAQAVNIGG